MKLLQLKPCIGVALLASVVVLGSNFGSSGMVSVPADPVVMYSKIKVEIWSDVMCPFCYIGKKRFEADLEKFEGKENVEVIWKSYQLNPNLKTDPSKNTIQHLSESKGWTMDYTTQTIDYVKNMAAGEGLKFDFEHAVVANSFDAHRIIQFAKTKGLGSEAEERFFSAYFTEGKNTADHVTLLQLGKEIGLPEDELSKILKDHTYADQVAQDVNQADSIGVTGVPFFLINRKYAISGAQESKSFLQTLQKAAREVKQQ
jgi:predicted DsbA family dithiol-disulfide isomerase